MGGLQDYSAINKSMSLRDAHLGYEYQDAVVACLAIDTLLAPETRLFVDLKRYPGDLFDDATVESGGGASKFQVKHSAAREAFDLADLRTGQRKCRVDDLAIAIRDDPNRATTVYRLVFNGPSPADTGGLLEPSDADPLFGGTVLAIDGVAMWSHVEFKFLEDHIEEQDFLDAVGRLTIEVGCYQQGEPEQPGELERQLFNRLSEQVGVDRYPNRKSSTDVGYRLIQVVRNKRGADSHLDTNSILSQLKLRTDLGRIAQEFPVDETRYVEPPGLRFVRDQLKEHQRIWVTAGPGAGKSWVMDRLREQLRAEGFVVAHHYCHLEPGDALASQRVTIDQLFANLTADVVEHCSGPGSRPLLGSGRPELAAAISDLDGEGVRVAVLVDGVDHVERRITADREIPRENLGLLQSLSDLELPESTLLVVASQPIATEVQPNWEPVQLPRWNHEQVGSIVERSRLAERLSTAGQFETERVLDEITAAADGNPLLATYLVDTLADRDEGLDLAQAVRDIGCEGSLANYYHCLLRAHDDTTAAWQVVRMLACIDFGVDARELGELAELPFRQNLHGVLDALRPVLAEVATQGGVRIYHDSLRQHVLDTASEEEMRAVFSRVADWLQQRGFQTDERSFASLVGYLLKCDRGDEALQLFDPSFAVTALSAGYLAPSIQRNLVHFASAAAEQVDFRAVLHAMEQRRAVSVSQIEQLGDPRVFGDAFASILGHERLARVLLDSGRPILEREAGLALCECCYRAGGTPPWREYLDLGNGLSTADDDRRVVGHDPNTVRWHALADLYGEHQANSLIRELAGESPVHATNVVIEVVRELSSSDADLVLEDLRTSDLPEPMARWLQFIEARLQPQGDVNTPSWDSLADAAVEADDWGLAISVFRAAGPDRQPQQLSQVLAHTLPTPFRRTEPAHLLRWLWQTEYLVGSGTADSGLLRTALHAAIPDDSWLRRFLELHIEFACFTAGSSAWQEVDRVFGELASHNQPFVGQPSACDLYSVEPLIRRELRAIMAAARDEAERVNDETLFSRACDFASDIRTNAGTTLQGSPAGPMTPRSLAQTLASFVAGPYGTVALERLLAVRDRVIESRTALYATCADLLFVCANALSVAGRTDEARQNWNEGCKHLTAYGMRKDITVFDLLMPMQMNEQPWTGSKERLARLKPLVDLSVWHSDGGETRWAPVQWFEAALRVDGEAGAAAAAAEILDGTAGDWRAETALAAHFSSKSDPDELDTAIAFALPSVGHAEDVAGALGALSRAQFGPLFCEAFARAFDGSDVEERPAAALACATSQLISRLASAESVLGARAILLEAVGPDDQTRWLAASEAVPVLPEFPHSAPDLLAWLASNRLPSRWDSRSAGATGLSIGARLVELADAGQREGARSVLLHLAHVVGPFSVSTLLAEAGAMLAAAREGPLAMEAYTLSAFCNLATLSDQSATEFRSIVTAMLGVDRETTRLSLARSFATLVREWEYAGYAAGKLACVGDLVFEDCWEPWDALADAIERRYPDLRASDEWEYPAGGRISLLLALAAHPDLSARRRATCAVRHLADRCGTDFANLVDEARSVADHVLAMALSIGLRAGQQLPADLLEQLAGSPHAGIADVAHAILTRRDGQRLTPVPQSRSEDPRPLVRAHQRALATVTLAEQESAAEEAHGAFVAYRSSDDGMARMRQRHRRYHRHATPGHREREFALPGSEVCDAYFNEAVGRRTHDRGRIADLWAAGMETEARLALSKVRRPNDIPRASQRIHEPRPPMHIPSGPYAGWARLGWWECEETTEENSHFISLAVAGIPPTLIGPGGGELARDDSTCGQPDIWTAGMPTGQMGPVTSGPLADFEMTWLPRERLLYLGRLCLNWLDEDLLPMPWPAGCSLVTSEGRPAFALRVWSKVVNEYGPDHESWRSHGVDLIASPSSWRAVQERAVAPVELWIADRSETRGP